MKHYLLLFLKGMAMGAADVVPGVSGGTVAFITGIYDELLQSLAQLPKAAMLLLRGRVVDAWQCANATFLLVLVSGILASVLSLARLITSLLETQPIALWSFFFGLILVSTHIVVRAVQHWGVSRLCSALLGGAFAWWITVAAPVHLEGTPVILFLAGAVAICAMILPGISGSFILLLLGLYPVVLGAVKELDLLVLAIFASGCLAGLLGFSRLLNWLLHRWRDLTLAFLAGLMLGSLNKVWPWKQTVSWVSNSHGKLQPLLQDNLWPDQFARLSGSDAQLTLAICLAIAGALLVLGLEAFAALLARRTQTEGS
jgi:putative membrane protein